jgi:hypothetical protein
MLSLASVDLGQDFSTELVSMGDLQTKLQNIQDRQALLDTRTLEDTVNEYVRLVNSIRVRIFYFTLVDWLLIVSIVIGGIWRTRKDIPIVAE